MIQYMVTNARGPRITKQNADRRFHGSEHEVDNDCGINFTGGLCVINVILKSANRTAASVL